MFVAAEVMLHDVPAILAFLDAHVLQFLCGLLGGGLTVIVGVRFSWLGGFHFSPNIRLAFARIFAALDALNLPLFTICVARALAFAAWILSGMGYLRSPGKPKLDLGSALRVLLLNVCSTSRTPLCSFMAR